MDKTFGQLLRQLRCKAGKSRYRMAQWSGLSEAYLMRLESGERANPSRDVVIMIALALVASSDTIDIFDIDELLQSAIYMPLRRRQNGSISNRSKLFADFSL